MRSEVDPAALARRRVRRRSALAAACRLRRCAAIARRRLPSRTTQRHVVGGEREAVGLVHQRLGAQRREVEDLEPARRLLVAAAAVRADDRQHASTAPCRRPRRRSGRSGSSATGNGAIAPRDARRGRRGRRRRGAPSGLASLAPGSSGRQPLGRGVERRRARRPAARSGRGAPRAESSTRTARCRTPGRTCASTGSTDIVPRGSNAGQ